MKKTRLFLFFVPVIMLMCSCGDNSTQVTGTRGQVKRIINGNTIQLQSGLKVQLLGISKDYEASAVFMESINLVGKKVKLISDKGDTKKTYQKASEKVRAYVFILPDNICLNGEILRQCAKSEPAIFSARNVHDSLDYWRTLLRGCNHEGNVPDIALYMKQRTFLVATPEGMGTGFFISSDGLAITNNHVLPPQYANSSVVYLYEKKADNSEVYRQNERKVKQVIYSSSVDDKDITIFRVSLNEGEMVPYFHLSKVQMPVGSHIQTFGNPSDKSGIMYTANYTQGTIGSYKTDEQHGRPNTQIVVYDIATNPGNSGGPVALDNGLVIAVHDVGSNAGEGINAGINILQVREMLDALNLDYDCK